MGAGWSNQPRQFCTDPVHSGRYWSRILQAYLCAVCGLYYQPKLFESLGRN